jgi:predicted nucleic acid-binding protein
LIAGIAVSRQISLVTRNRRDFEAFIKNSGLSLSLLDWTKPTRSAR